MTDLILLASRAMAMALSLVLFPALDEPAFGQVKTTVPDVVAGARPARMERITIHGKALESNLEGNAVDRTVLVTLPPSYAAGRNRRYPVAVRSRETLAAVGAAGAMGPQDARSAQPRPPGPARSAPLDSPSPGSIPGIRVVSVLLVA